MAAPAGRQAVEPAIGHLKTDHRMERCWLKGSEGDALHAVLCAAGFNIRWLLRAIVRLGLAGLFFILAALSLLRSPPSAHSCSQHLPAPLACGRAQTKFAGPTR